MMFNKKGTGIWEEIRPAVVVILLIAFAFWAVNKWVLGPASGADRPLVLAKLEKCKELGENGHPLTGEKYPDTDPKDSNGNTDGLPDICDNCPLLNNNCDDGTGYTCDKDSDLFRVGCQGNDGTGKPCAPTETEELDKDAKRHPCYKVSALG